MQTTTWRVVGSETDAVPSNSPSQLPEYQRWPSQTHYPPTLAGDAVEELSFKQSQWIGASLGETILRAETAAIAALAIARAEV